MERTQVQLDLYPVVEWHRSTAATEKNQLSAKLRTEVYFDLDSDLSRAIGPFFFADAGAVKDYVSDGTTFNGSLFGSFYVNEPWAPHNGWPDGEGRTRLFYYPMLGFERVEQAVPVARDAEEMVDLSSTFTTGRFYIEI